MFTVSVDNMPLCFRFCYMNNEHWPGHLKDTILISSFFVSAILNFEIIHTKAKLEILYFTNNTVMITNIM